MTAVEVCPICDIAGCRHIRERKAKMTDLTEEELYSLVEYLRGKAFISQREADAICALRTQLAKAKAEKESLGRELNLARYGQPDFSWQVHKEAIAEVNARADRAEAALADADAMIEAQAKDHAENNIRFAEMAHRVSQLAEAQDELSRRVDMHECAMADRAKAALAAQIEVEPVAWRWESCANSQRWNTRYGCEKPTPSDYITDIVPLYATQPHDRSALDLVRAEAREKALREAIEAYPKGIEAILALIEKKVT